MYSRQNFGKRNWCELDVTQPAASDRNFSNTSPRDLILKEKICGIFFRLSTEQLLQIAFT